MFGLLIMPSTCSCPAAAVIRCHSVWALLHEAVSAFKVTLLLATYKECQRHLAVTSSTLCHTAAKVCGIIWRRLHAQPQLTLS